MPVAEPTPTLGSTLQSIEIGLENHQLFSFEPNYPAKLADKMALP